MIVASSLLILVAVTLLVLGLTGGSSTLLISSIVASLLAAVALVVGARQAATTRRGAADQPAGPEPAVPDPGVAGPGAGFDEPESAYPSPGFGAPDDTAEFLAEPEFLAERAARSAPPPPPAAEPVPGGRRGRRRETGADDDFVPTGEGSAADSTSSAAAGEPWAGADPALDLDLDLGDDAGERQFTTQAVDEHAARAAGSGEAAPDYDRASSAINAARSENPEEHAWRREPGPAPDDLLGADDLLGPDDLPGAADRPAGDDLPGRDVHAEAAAHAGLSVLDDDFAEPDADDPDDEPLPQAVRPTDAVRVARLDAEVLVVDGRPRYHLADCTHLIGRLTEPIPVNEAVELGFSPCGLCRPVDRLVAAAAGR